MARSLRSRLAAVFLRVKDSALDRCAVTSYAQEGEDLILRGIFFNEPTGYYVDVGALHPRRFSNTYLFYKMGWSGINIDATPGSMRRFRRQRPRDINLEIPLAADSREIQFYLFDEPALNSFDRDLSNRRVAEGYRVEGVRILRTRTLATVLTKHLPRNTSISFMTVDVEGFDFEVLQSNDWQRFRPKCILVECLGSDLSEIRKSSVCIFLEEQGYQLFAKTVRTLIFRESKG
jgi:hypothetical protein